MAATSDNVVIPFGRYTGRTIVDIFNLDPSYLPILRDRAVVAHYADALDDFCDRHFEAIAAATDQRDMRRERDELLRRHG